MFNNNNKKEVFCAAIDVEYLQQIRGAVVEMICNVTNSVTAMGWQFPGTSGPGVVVYKAKAEKDAPGGALRRTSDETALPEIPANDSEPYDGSPM